MSDDDWNSSSFPSAVVVEVNKPNCTRRAACLHRKAHILFFGINGNKLCVGGRPREDTSNVERGAREGSASCAVVIPGLHESHTREPQNGRINKRSTALTTIEMTRGLLLLMHLCCFCWRDHSDCTSECGNKRPSQRPATKKTWS